MTVNPTLYDVLGVSQDATTEQIKAAWRDAADRFDPASGAAHFRLFNQAAEVLLDPAKRKEYDASLAEGTPAEETPAESKEPGTSATPTTEQKALTTPTEEGWSEAQPKPDRPRTNTDRTVPLVPLLVLAGLAALALATALFFLFAKQLPADHADQVARDAATAQSTAERAAAQVLSYDYEHLDTDRDAAARYLTPSYRKEYVNTFNKLVQDPATSTKAKVSAEVKSSAVMSTPEDGRVEVLLFVDQTTSSTANNGQPQTALNRVRLEMVDRDGTWLVNQVQSY